MLALPVEHVEQRAKSWVRRLSAAGIDARVIEGRSAAGGGSLPGETVPTRLAAIAVESPDTLAARLRENEPPVITRIENDLLCLDPRTVLPAQEQALLSAVLACFEAEQTEQ
jgi:L-seryl-tRNA(Ser) seleniumtransferase